MRARSRNLSSTLIEGRAKVGAADALSAIAGVVASLGATNEFRDGLLRMVGTARTTSTSCALFGTLAGAHYGAESIPEAWRRLLADQAVLQALAQRLPT